MDTKYPEDPKLTYAIIRLSDTLEKQHEEPDADYADITSRRDDVLRQYQPIFNSENIKNLTKDDFLSFLLIKNNHHWDSLHRVGKPMTEDMGLLREALGILLDERRGVRERLNELRPERYWGKNSMVSHLGMPVLTAILTVSYPDKYGVWNNTSDAGLREVKLWKKEWETLPAGDSYVEMNDIYHELCQYLQVDLWTLDALWWVVKKKKT